MERKKKLPVGIEDFSEFMSEDFYYVDKTGLIIDLLHKWGKVNLFTRPRRFGKSLNMSMLKAFFETGCDRTLFDGLKIAGEQELCREYMGQYPVISVTLKGVSGTTFQAACAAMRRVIGMEAMRFSFLKTSDALSEMQKKMYQSLIEIDKDGSFFMSMDALEGSLQTLSSLLYQHYGRKVILLIDEYDVPLERAFHGGYYQELAELIRNLFGNTLKTNDSLQFAVLTGCLRISKESIFTGLNNLNVLSVMDPYFDEYFGFTDQEVKEMLSYYDLDFAYDTIKEWYDGYRFGNAAVYCPWDVIKYCYALAGDRNAEPEPYWINTSSNSIVKRFIMQAPQKARNEIEQLIAGETIWKEIHMELTYSELDKSIDNLWSVLLTTGYLTQRAKEPGGRCLLAIPNREIRQIFITQIKEWFAETTAEDMSRVIAFCNAFRNADTEMIEREFGAYLRKTISIRDTGVPLSKKENFYHGILLGLLMHMDAWNVSSNAESGDGYSDILIEIDEENIGIIIEMKYGENGALDAGCAEALKQIRERRYEERLIDDGMEKILKYGIACYKKRCRVVLGN